MYLDENGFLLNDALICVFIVSILSAGISTAVLSHVSIQDSIHSQSEMINEDLKENMENVEICEICKLEETAGE